MMIKPLYIVSLLVALFSTAHARDHQIMTRQEYIDMWSSVAVQQMIEHKIPASITLAQGILESGDGNSVLARLANNHFGIKCHDWKGETIYHDDDKPNECFRKYASADLSYEDHSVFLTSRKRYSKLFTLKITDYKQWAHGLKSAGYATNPRYATALIELIETHKLYEFDQLALQAPKSPPKPSVIVSYSQEKQTKKELKPSDIEINLSGKRTVLSHDNQVRYILAQKGDTYANIAKMYGLTLRQILKYNDANDEYTFLKPGDIINIHPKKTKGKALSKSYESDMTIREISQLEGVKLKKLLERNHLTSSSPNYIVKKGTVVFLK